MEGRKHLGKRADQAVACERGSLAAMCTPATRLLTFLPYRSKRDIREALDNFRAYVSILREWDRKERLETHDSVNRDRRDTAID